MNELLFLIQILFITGFALGALRLGLHALITWVVIQALLANLFVLKQISLSGLEVTASDAYAIGSLLGLNFLQEYYSQDDAKKASYICFFCLAFFTLASQLHLLYQPSVHDQSQQAYMTIFSASPRLFIASMTTFFIVQQVDVRFFSFLKERLTGSSFALRSAIALIFSQLLDTFLFSFTGLYGIVASMFDIILMSFLIKLAVICCSAPFVRWARQ